MIFHDFKFLRGYFQYLDKYIEYFWKNEIFFEKMMRYISHFK